MENSSVRILFLAHTPQEAKCYLPIDKYISSKLNTSSVYITQDTLYKQNVQAFLSKSGVTKKEIIESASGSVNYTKLSFVGKIKTFIKAYKELQSYINKCDAVVLGASNIVARAAYQRAKECGKLLFQIVPSYRHTIDGKYGIYESVKNAVCDLIGFESLKNVEGRYELDIDKRFLPGERIRQVFERRGVPSSEIQVTGVPRFRHLFEKKYSWKPSNKNSDQVSVLYIMGSFLSHYDEVGHKLQKRKLVSLLEHIRTKENKSVSVYVKLHPRNIKEVENFVKSNEHIKKVYRGEENASMLCTKHDLVVSQNSTVSYHAAVMGCPVVLYTENVARTEGKSIFDDFTVVKDPKRIVRLAKSIKTNGIPDEVFPDRNKIYETISKKTPRSHKIIGDKIIKYLESS